MQNTRRTVLWSLVLACWVAAIAGYEFEVAKSALMVFVLDAMPVAPRGKATGFSQRPCPRFQPLAPQERVRPTDWGKPRKCGEIPVCTEAEARFTVSPQSGVKTGRGRKLSYTSWVGEYR